MSSGSTPEDDGLPIDEVGQWVEEKHARLRAYIDISRAVRAKFSGPGTAGTTYIDLYCGPGRLRERASGKLIDGSPLVAAATAQQCGRPFGDIHVADADATAVHATARRLKASGITAPIHDYVGTAEDTAGIVAQRLNPYGLHVVFLDPYNLGDLPFSVIQAFGQFKHADLLIHVSAMDLQRNLEQAIDSSGIHQMDLFAPGWRETVDTKKPPHDVRRAIIGHWIGLVRGQGFTVYEEQFELITGGQNQPLYWLAFAAKNAKASEFWDKIRNVSGQRGLF